MEIKKNIYLAFVAVMLVFVVSGCSGYGKIKAQSGYEDDITIENLIENWQDYTVYYAGYAINNPSGIMFDPKNDDKTLMPSDRWTKLDDKESIIDVISWIKTQDTPEHPTLVYRILAPKNQSYGYLFSAWDHLLTKVVDGNTLWVYDLPDPPYAEEGNGNEPKAPSP